MRSSVALSRALDMYRASDHTVASTDFLSPREIAEVYNELIARIGTGISRCFFWGGSRGAERCAAVFLPEWLIDRDFPGFSFPGNAERTEAFSRFLVDNPDVLGEIPITALRITGSGFRNLTHRDFMGGVLSLGITREVVGDIAVMSESEAVMFVSSRIADFITSELTKIGRDRVTAERFDAGPGFEIPRKYEDKTLNVASMRLDCFVKAITGRSRSEAGEMVRLGLADLSYDTPLDVSAKVESGDIISVRGYGKYIIGEQTGTTKSGMLKVACRKYI